MEIDEARTYWIQRHQEPFSSYDIAIGSWLEKIVARRFLEAFYHRVPLILPYRLVELGAGRTPMAAESFSIIQKLGGHPELIMSDIVYSDEDIGMQARQCVQRYVQYSTAVRGPRTELSLESLILDSRGIPGFEVPNNWSEYILFFSSLANYVSRECLCEVITDPKVRAIAFVNSTQAGRNLSGNPFDDDRFSSTLDILEVLGKAGFKTLDAGIQYDMRMNKSDYIAPAFGMFLVRPQDELEEEWIRKNGATKYLPI